MNVTHIKVLAGRTFNHPHESYSNFKHSVVLESNLAAGEDPVAAVKDLQAKAEQLAEDHKNHILNSVETLHEMAACTREIQSLESTIKNAQVSLEAARARMQQNGQPLLPIGTTEQDTMF